MKEDNAKREESYNHFIKESIRDLKATGHCYVYSKVQVNEVLERIKEKAIVETNECGYTISIKTNKKDRSDKK